MKNNILLKAIGFVALSLVAFKGLSFETNVDSEVKGANLSITKEGSDGGDLTVGGALTVGTVSNASVPAGVIVMWSGDPTDLPAGWALCNGENGTPNLSGRFVVGYDAANVDYDDVSTFAARTGGEDEPVISVEQMPSHNHSNLANGSYGADPGPGDHMADNIPGGVTGDTGGNQPFDNRPAYFVIAYIIKL